MKKSKLLSEYTFLELRNLLWDCRYDIYGERAWGIYEEMKRRDPELARKEYDWCKEWSRIIRANEEIDWWGD